MTETYKHTFFEQTVVSSVVSSAVLCEAYTEAEIVVYVGGVSGTLPTLVPEIEVSGDGEHWIHRYTIVDTETEGDLVRLTAPTVEGKIRAVGTFGCILRGNLGKYVRLSLTVGGTSPVFILKAKGFFR